MAFDADKYIADLVAQGWSRADAAMSARYEAQNPAYRQAVAPVTPAASADVVTPAASATVGNTTDANKTATGYSQDANGQWFVNYTDGTKSAVTQQQASTTISQVNTPSTLTGAGSVITPTNAGSAPQPAATTPAATAGMTQAQADEFAKKQKASDAMVATFKQYGLDSLANFISGEIMADVAPEALLIKLYDQPEYQARFPGMKALQAKNRTITEAQYISLENQYAETLRFYDLPAGFMDDRATFGKMIANEVSPKELQDRAQVAQDLAKTTNPLIRKALTDFYGVGEGGITAYVLDADRALPIIQKQAKTATIAGVGGAAGFNLTNTEADLMASKAVYQNLNESDMTKAFGQAEQLRNTQQRLAFLDRSTYDQKEALNAVIENDQQAILESQKRAQREIARFGGGTGLTSGSLRESSGI